ncbi:hypothetical protein BD414DRAFT_474778 [Trametes punicea]|nr:hypothetical protein BD414DRAFT_474778 [Trametes punicea]
MDAVDKSQYSQLNPVDERPPMSRRQHSHQILRRTVSRALSTLTGRASSSSSQEGDNSESTTSSVSPRTSRTSRVEEMSVVDRRGDAVPYTPTYPIVRLDPVLIGCLVCL